MEKRFGRQKKKRSRFTDEDEPYQRKAMKAGGRRRIKDSGSPRRNRPDDNYYEDGGEDEKSI